MSDSWYTIHMQDLTSVHDGFKELYFGTMDNHGQWLDVTEEADVDSDNYDRADCKYYCLANQMTNEFTVSFFLS